MMFDSRAPFPELHTGRLLLRQLQPTDAAAIYALRSDPQVNKYLDRDPCASFDDAAAFISRMLDFYKQGAGLYWAICFSGSDGLAGTICLFDHKEATLQCEMGFEVLPVFQGKGVMQEAARAVMSYAFHTQHMKTIVATAHRDNQRSINLLHRLGFVYRVEVYGDFAEFVAAG